MSRKNHLSVAFVAAAVALTSASCDRSRTERWTTTENTNVPIDWDRVNEAYKQADGPEDFERRVNEIYEGDELVSVSVQDLDAKSQVVTGFFDKNANGAVEDEEKIFTIRRDVSDGESAHVQTVGYGHYGYYHSPIMTIASGMLIGSMISNAFRPNYVPVYTRPYTTSLTRASDLRAQRQSYRAANPSRFSKAKVSGSGRQYNSSGSGRTRVRTGGTRFGAKRRTRPLVRLDA